MESHVGPVEAFQEGSMTIREVAGLSIGIFRRGDSFYAMLNICPHRAAPVCQGLVGGTMLPSQPGEFVPGLEGLVLRCPWHGWEFDLRTGESIGPVDKRNLTRIAVSVRDGAVYVNPRQRLGAA